MSKFTLAITTDNAAFTEGYRSQELARILLGLVDRLRESPSDDYDLSQPLRDINGNKVGRVEDEPPAVEDEPPA